MPIQGAGDAFKGMMSGIQGMAGKVSMPKMSMPSRSDISGKLSEIKSKYSGSRLESALNKAGRGMKTGAAHTLIGCGILTGSDKALNRGESLRGSQAKVRSGEAEFRRSQTGLKIKKQYHKTVASFGRKVGELGNKVFYNHRVSSNSKIGKAR